jgi:peptidoglycan/LPS O-acetylase OafA/YrhL
MVSTYAVRAAAKPSTRNTVSKTPRLGGLDGLRALAVAAVVLFHLDASLAPGGFLGVDLFFVISGFLITRLLLMEIDATGSIDLGRFYWRRARRLLPAMLALVGAVSVASELVWRDQLATLRGGALSSLGYVTNWWLVLDHQSYFVATGRPSMLQHLWSLAVEEQFYVVWSLALITVAAYCRRRRPGDAPRVVARLALALGIASAAVMTVLALRSDLPYGGSTSRAYFGSDTHSSGLFLGAAAGAWRVGRTRRAGRAPHWARCLPTDLLGAAALALVVLEFLWGTEYAPGLYRGGFAEFAAVATIAVLCLSRAGSLLGRVIDVAPLRWIGERSYSIYLWHWPVIVVTRPGLDVHGPLLLVDVARAALIVALGAASYRFVESPLRHWAGRRRQPGSQRQPGSARAPITLGAVLVAAGAISAAIVLVIAGSPLMAPHSAQAAGIAPLTTPRAASPTSVPSSAGVGPSAGPTVAGTTSAAPAAPMSSAAPAAAPPVPPPPVGRPRISAFGDSVVLGAASALRGETDQLEMDAVEGRQANPILADINAAEAAGSLMPIVLIHIGDNGIISPSQLSDTLSALSDRTRVILMNTRVPRDWQDPNNAALSTAAARFPNVKLVDWLDLSGAQPGWLYSDGIHLTPDGSAAYAQIVIANCP